MGSPLGNAVRVLVIIVIGLLVVLAGFGLLSCTICAVSGGGISGSDRLGFAIGTLVCLAILVGGVLVIGKLAKGTRGDV